MNKKPTFISRDTMTSDEGYVQWMADIYNERVEIRHQLGGQLGTALDYPQGDESDIVNRHQAGDQLEMPEIFGQVPWTHHVHIISKCQSLDEAQFYIYRVVEEGWSRSRLENQIAANLVVEGHQQAARRLHLPARAGGGAHGEGVGAEEERIRGC